MKDNKDFLGREPIGKLLLTLSLPTIAAQIINMFYNCLLYTSDAADEL